MSLSVLIPVHDKPQDVLGRVFGALEGQEYDQCVIVLDRASQAVTGLAEKVPRAVLVPLSGPPGWRSPCQAFNAGLAAVTSDIVLLNHSDIVQTPDACVRAKELQARELAVYFGLVPESDPQDLHGAGHAGPILMGTPNPRAMLFFTCMPTQALRDAGGWDIAYEAGTCYEDDDVIARLWKSSRLPFIWDDTLAAVHVTHDRPYFMDEPVAINRGLFLGKHGTSRFLWREEQTGRLVSHRDNGRVRFDHA